MITYYYRCESCKEESEHRQRMSDDALTVCEACGEPEMKRLIKASRFLLKGADWEKRAHVSGKPRRFKKEG